MSTEIWKDILGYEGLYQVSNLGNVRSLDKFKEVNHKTIHFKYVVKGKILKYGIDKNGYFHVNLYKNKKPITTKIHKLVAIAFLNHVPNGYTIVVDHIDNDKTNNKLDNLQLISHRENISKNQKNKSSKYTGVYFCNTTKKWKSTIRINKVKVFIGSYETELEASNSYQNKLKEI